MINPSQDHVEPVDSANWIECMDQYKLRIRNSTVPLIAVVSLAHNVCALVPPPIPVVI